MTTSRKTRKAARSGAVRKVKRSALPATPRDSTRPTLARGARGKASPARARSTAAAGRAAQNHSAPEAALSGRGGAGAKLVRYVALLRGVSPMNAKMPELARCFERAGFTNVKTVLGSGNVVFSAPRSATRAVEERAFAAMQEHLDRTFPVIVRTGAALAALVADDPWQRLELAPGSKQVVTFLARPAPANIALPAAVDGARLLAIEGTMVLSAYVPHPTKGPVFMALLEKTFGKEITTRTWDTVKKLVRAASVV